MKSAPNTDKITNFIKSLKEANITVASFDFDDTLTAQHSWSSYNTDESRITKDVADKIIPANQSKFIDELFKALKQNNITVAITSRQYGSNIQRILEHVNIDTTNVDIIGRKSIHSGQSQSVTKEDALLLRYKEGKVMHFDDTDTETKMKSFRCDGLSLVGLSTKSPYFNPDNIDRIVKKITRRTLITSDFVKDLKDNNIDILAISLDDIINEELFNQEFIKQFTYTKEVFCGQQEKIISGDTKITSDQAKDIPTHRGLIRIINELSAELQSNNIKLVITSTQHNSVVEQILKNLDIKTDNIDIVGYDYCKRLKNARKGILMTNVLSDIYKKSNLLHLSSNGVRSHVECYNLGLKGSPIYNKSYGGPSCDDNNDLHTALYNSLIFTKIIDLVKLGAKSITVDGREIKVDTTQDLKYFIGSIDLDNSFDVSHLKNILNELKQQEMLLKVTQSTQKADTEQKPQDIRNQLLLSIKQYESALLELNSNQYSELHGTLKALESQSNESLISINQAFKDRLSNLIESKVKNIGLDRDRYQNMLRNTRLSETGLIRILSGIHADNKWLAEPQDLNKLDVGNLDSTMLAHKAAYLHKEAQTNQNALIGEAEKKEQELKKIRESFLNYVTKPTSVHHTEIPWKLFYEENTTDDILKKYSINNGVVFNSELSKLEPKQLKETINKLGTLIEKEKSIAEITKILCQINDDNPHLKYSSNYVQVSLHISSGACYNYNLALLTKEELDKGCAELKEKILLNEELNRMRQQLEDTISIDHTFLVSKEQVSNIFNLDIKKAKQIVKDLRDVLNNRKVETKNPQIKSSESVINPSISSTTPFAKETVTNNSNVEDNNSQIKSSESVINPSISSTTPVVVNKSSSKLNNPKVTNKPNKISFASKIAKYLRYLNALVKRCFGKGRSFDKSMIISRTSIGSKAPRFLINQSKKEQGKNRYSCLLNKSKVRHKTEYTRAP